VSGGSFNYLFIKDADEVFANPTELRRMVQELTVFPEAADVAADAANALAVVDYQTARLQTHLDRLKDVFHAIEWWQSGDWSEDDVRKAIAEYRCEVTS
jgi:hypothetical protein